MKTEDRIKKWKVYPSIRGQFAFELYKLMAKDKNVILLTGDLGWGMFDEIQEDMPEQYINCGASEQAMLGIAVGMALVGKLPFVYSITPFVLYRGFETIRNYIDHERINVKLIGSGRDQDYQHDGFSHDASDAQEILKNFKRIKTYWPNTNETLTRMVKELYESTDPCFISLKR